MVLLIIFYSQNNSFERYQIKIRKLKIVNNYVWNWKDRVGADDLYDK